jgi:hypothetical protein
VRRAVVHDGDRFDFNEELGTKESWNLNGVARRRAPTCDA